MRDEERIEVRRIERSAAHADVPEHVGRERLVPPALDAQPASAASASIADDVDVGVEEGRGHGRVVLAGRGRVGNGA